MTRGGADLFTEGKKSALALRKDMNRLMDAFCEQEDHSLAAFQKAWGDLRFSNIHLCRGENETQEQFMRLLYAAAMHACTREDEVATLACLYTLHCLQLTNRPGPRIPVPIPVAFRERLARLRPWLTQKQVKDGRRILDRLMKDKLAWRCLDIQHHGSYLSHRQVQAGGHTSLQARVKEVKDSRMELLVGRSACDTVDCASVESDFHLYQAARTAVLYGPVPSGCADPQQQAVEQLRKLPWIASPAHVVDPTLSPGRDFAPPKSAEDVDFTPALKSLVARAKRHAEQPLGAGGCGLQQVLPYQVTAPSRAPPPIDKPDASLTSSKKRGRPKDKVVFRGSNPSASTASTEKPRPGLRWAAKGPHQDKAALCKGSEGDLVDRFLFTADDRGW